MGETGFSEGALALSMMLWEQQHPMGWRIVLATTLGFRRDKLLLLPNEALLWLNARAQGYGLGKALMKVPMLHIYDNRDICLGRAQKLVRTTAFQMDAGHHLPTKKEEVMDFRR